MKLKIGGGEFEFHVFTKGQLRNQMRKRGLKFDFEGRPGGDSDLAQVKTGAKNVKEWVGMPLDTELVVVSTPRGSVDTHELWLASKADRALESGRKPIADFTWEKVIAEVGRFFTTDVVKSRTRKGSSKRQPALATA